MSDAAWSLDPVLAQHSIALGDLALSRVLISTDANYPWLILVPRRAAIVEIFELADADQPVLMAEIAATGRALKSVTRCDKLNIAALGNAVPQLHVHIIARFRNDAAGARPVFGAVPARAYDDAELARFVASLRAAIDLM